MSDILAQISDQPLDPAVVDAAVAGPEHGAVVVFTGVVRNHDGGQSVSDLEYQSHPDACLLYTSPSPRDLSTSRMPSSA